MARGAYLKDLGNTPGHLNHWSKRSFVALLSRHGEVVEARSPFPWTMLLVRLGDRRPGRRRRRRRRAATALTRAARASCSIGIASTGVFTFAYFAVASHVLGTPDAYGAISLLWSVLFVVISVIYRPVEQLLSRTIADRRARGHRAAAIRCGRRRSIQAGFAAAFLVVALALQGPIEDAVRRRETLYWIFVVATLAYAASYFARG